MEKEPYVVPTTKYFQEAYLVGLQEGYMLAKHNHKTPESKDPRPWIVAAKIQMAVEGILHVPENSPQADWFYGYLSGSEMGVTKYEQENDWDVDKTMQELQSKPVANERIKLVNTPPFTSN
jgi:hypothetical protein